MIQPYKYVKVRPWFEIAHLCCKNRKINKATFDSWGDWECVIYQVSTDYLLLWEVQQLVYKHFKYFQYVDQNYGKFVDSITTFAQALTDCSMQYENLQKFMNKKNIQDPVTFYERLADDGNTKISLLSTKTKYYIIRFDSS